MQDLRAACIVVVMGAMTFWSGAARASAGDVYVAQTATGSANGTNCANAYAATFFNVVGNWGNGLSQIGPGTTVHLCGVITNLLLFRASGLSGQPITLHFEAGARLSQAAGTLIRADGISNVVIDGGSDGILENTDNGTALGHRLAVSGIYAPGASNLEIKRLTIRNLYVHTDVTDSSIDFTASGGVYLNGASNVSIHDCTFSDICWVINAVNGTGGLLVYNNRFANYDHGVAGVGGVGASNAVIHDNHFGPTANWDTTANRYHHDGVHVFFASGSSLSGLSIYNNVFDGDWGYNNTAHIFLEGDFAHPSVSAISNAMIFNNVHSVYPGKTLNNGMIAGNGPDWQIYNNTYLGSGFANSSCVRIGGSNLSFRNNLISGCNTFLYTSSTTVFGVEGLNHNLYAARAPGGNPAFWFGSAMDLAHWQAATEQDGDAAQVSSAGTTADGHLQSGSPATSMGANLTAVGIPLLRSDKAGVKRPSSGPWDIGAYQGVWAADLAPPSALTASAH